MYNCQVFEFFESKRVPMDMNPGLISQLHALDWHLQRRRLQANTAIADEAARQRAFDFARAKLLTWHTGRHVRRSWANPLSLLRGSV